MGGMTIDALTVAAERSEAAMMMALESRAEPETARRLGIDAAEIGGGVVLAVRDDPSEYWSKTYCLGLATPITDAIVGQVLDFYRDNGNKSAVLQIAPAALPPDWAEICGRHGLAEGTSWHKLVRDVDGEWPSAETSLRIAPVGLADRVSWARTVMRGFGMPEELAPMISNVLAEEGVTSFGAYEDGELVGSGTLAVVDVAGGRRVGQLAAGMTLSDHRGRGGQSALIATRLRAAIEAGAELLAAETGDEKPGEHNTSLHNLLRFGFRVLYKRQNWLWRA
jgi:GNAT superfamily N-acetyltransferase